MVIGEGGGGGDLGGSFDANVDEDSVPTRRRGEEAPDVELFSVLRSDN